ncbi:type IV pilus twitching motility protein PilT [Desulfurispora thermophila]|uniref:type IV pilus twitching motility protein PilT n=1 Tax=Desulfurispora thermophila TaxID=265470 RepID=UPI000371DC61|nr:type IV pilus twitching motility protein PilT [Desulfurispora thermophila]
MLEQILRTALARRASDIHLTVDSPPVLRLHGQLVRLEQDGRDLTLTPAVLEDMLQQLLTPAQLEQFRERGDLDLAYSLPDGARFRVNVYRQKGYPAVALRVINTSIPSFHDLGLPEVIARLARLPRGLVLVTGPTGSGKSTTLAAMVDLINREQAVHILTLEDPIEYVHRHKKAVVNQREIGHDSLSFAAALRAAMREDPDVILVGEMRDPETIAVALTAAETGHLVLATLHTSSAAQTVDRIIDVFPPYQQQQIRVQLANSLQGVVSQQLIPRADRQGRVLALEIMVVTPAIRNLIREGKTYQIISQLQTGGKFGMQTMDAHLRHLYQQRLIGREEVLGRAQDPESLAKML